MLHTVNKSPLVNSSLEQCIEFLAKDEPILLYEDAVYAAQAGTRFEIKIQALLKTNPVYALQADLKARAVNNIINGVKIVDYNGFVDLVAEHKVQNWL
ncbi:MAG: sulfurtransferase complex subunit TusB [Spirochaetia bacterium]|nr:sulfurtransferase complex subunit TusB [Spirochaetia bacterium]